MNSKYIEMDSSNSRFFSMAILFINQKALSTFFGLIKLLILSMFLRSWQFGRHGRMKAIVKIEKHTNS